MSYHATVRDFRDLDLMFKIAEEPKGIASLDLVEAVGFDAEDGARPIGSRLAWMRRYGMVDKNRDDLWQLTRGGSRVLEARLRAPELRRLEELPDEAMIEVMALVTSRFQRKTPNGNLLSTMLRREFLFGTQ
jgi:hypothetical protein